jgi:uncharacterized membrane protein
MDTQPRSPSHASQQGSVVVILAIAIGMLIALLGSIQIGYSFYVKRELQKAADMAALSGVQELIPDDVNSCTEAALNRALSIAHHNTGNLKDLSATNIEPICGSWAVPANYNSEAGAPHPSFFVAGKTPYNAVQVKINYDIPPIIPLFDASEGSASAVAVSTEPVAAFSVGSRLLSVRSDGLVGSLLSTVGLQPDLLTVLDSTGLANARITPAGLLQALGLPASIALGAGSPDDLLKLEQLTLGDLLNATVTAVSQSGVADTSVSLLNDAIQTILSIHKLDVPIKLFGDQGVMAIVKTAEAAAALQTQVNVADLISTTLMMANGTNLINLPLNNVLFAVEGKVQVVEPPSIGVGPAGTVAHSAQIRIYLRVTTDSIPVVGPLLRTAGTYVDIPIIVEVANSKGRLANVCAAPIENNQATIDVSSTAVNLCVGRFQSMDANGNQFFSTTNACHDDAMDPDSGVLARYKVLNILNILPISSRVAMPLFPTPQPVPVTLTAPESENSSKTVQTGNLDLAQTAKAAADAVLGGILGDLLGPSPGYSTNSQTETDLAKELVLRDNGGSRSVSEVVNSLQWSREALDALGSRMTSNGLTGFVGGTLQVVGNTLNTILIAPLADLGCTLAGLGGQKKVNECRVNGVKTLALSGDNFVAGLASIAIALLQPLLDPLSQTLQQLLDVLGVNLGETDVSLHAVQCGAPRLVE